jgi:hypothetical protein
MIEATITNDTEPKDIFYPGNLVVSENKRVVVVTKGTPTAEWSFCGTELSSANFGHHSRDWYKPSFTQFTQSITLKYKP